MPTENRQLQTFWSSRERLVMSTENCQLQAFWSSREGLVMPTENRQRPTFLFGREGLVMPTANCQLQAFWSSREGLVMPTENRQRPTFLFGREGLVMPTANCQLQTFWSSREGLVMPTENRQLPTFLFSRDGLSIPTENRQLPTEKLLSIARSQIGVREATGNNDGQRVEAYLNYTGNKKGDPWCASFVSWVFGQAGHAAPRTAWSPALFPTERQVDTALPSMVFGIYFPSLKRIAHCGLVEGRKDNWLTTIEGNTNVDGGREGDGVYRKRRHLKTIKVFADWLPFKQKGGLR